MPLSRTKEQLKEIHAKGDKIYKEIVRPAIDVQKQKGRVVAIDVNSSEYDIGDEVIDSSDKLLARVDDPEIWLCESGIPQCATSDVKPKKNSGDHWFGLADGSSTDLQVYLATVKWDGNQRIVTVDESHGTILVGMAMLQGHDLSVEVREGGQLTIKAFDE